MRELKVGDRVKLIDKNSIWFGNEYIVTGIIEGASAYAVDDSGGKLYTFLIEHLQVVSKEPTNQSPVDILQRIQTFTKKHKNLEISFGDGKIIMRDSTSFESDDYHCDTILQLEELMDAWEIVSRFKVDND